MTIKINQINLNYEVHGEGKPLIFLHGNGESLNIFRGVIPLLENKFKMYLIDSRCHGKSDDTKDITYELMRDDIIAFIKALNISKPLIYGFSDGGIIALEIAIKEPKLLSKIIISGPNLNPRGFKLLMRLYVNLGYLFTQNKLFKLMKEEPNISLKELQKIVIPTVILAGSKDIIKKKHLEAIKSNIANAKLKIINGETHTSYVHNSTKLVSLIKEYLN